MKLTVLSENAVLYPRLEAEFGLSVYLEEGNTRLLFDAGERGACLRNAEKLGIDLRRVTAVAFSHNHRDHCGGFLRLAEQLPPDVPIYAHSGFFIRKWWDHRCDPPQQETYSQTLELVGPPMEASWFFQQGLTGFRCLADDCIQIAPHVYLLGNFPVPGPEEAVHPSSVMEGPDGRLVLDTFPEEQVCVVDTPAGLVVLTGCAHNGIRNILSTVERRFPERPIQAVFGGTHLVPPDPERIARTADYFRHSSITCAGVCHCTGPMGLEVFAQTVPAYLPTGAGLVWQTPSFARTSAGRKESCPPCRARKLRNKTPGYLILPVRGARYPGVLSITESGSSAPLYGFSPDHSRKVGALPDKRTSRAETRGASAEAAHRSAAVRCGRDSC